jgi:two-component system response regulator ResD
VKAKVLIVDDDKTLLHFLTEYLEGEGYAVVCADRGTKALRLFYDEQPDIVVLDVMMPGMDGWEVCARIRELSDTPVILLTAKTSEGDKLRGFRLGVDDYITKPFSLAELSARIQAVLSRTAKQFKDQRVLIELGQLVVDMRKREARMAGQPLHLTPTEFRLLATLAQHPGEAVAHDQLVEAVWGANRRESSSVLRRYISRLRKMIEDDPGKPVLLVTVRGFGYRLEA